MKTLFNIALIIIIGISFSVALEAQTTATWQGGMPGKPTDWNTSANWKENRIPDEFSQVIIPADKVYYPILKTEVEAIDALFIENGASLHVDVKGKLSVLGETGRMDVMTIFGNIQNEGMLDVHLEDGQQSMTAHHIQGHGVVINSLQETLTASR